MLRIRRMTVDDLPLGMRLKSQAGWNQVEDDWQRMLTLDPEGAFVAEWDGLPVGTTMAVRFGDLAWIAMVLVDADHRGRGIGGKLVESALGWLDKTGISTVRLDATPLGRPVYERLGFRPQFELSRWEGISRPDSSSTPGGAPEVTPVVLDEICRLDRHVTRTDRRNLLDYLVRSNPTSLRVVTISGRLAGFGLSRPGSLARFIGPCISEEDCGESILQSLLANAAARRVFVDIPGGNPRATAIAQRFGLSIQRTLTRMVRGPAVQEELSCLFASSGPELG